MGGATCLFFSGLIISGNGLKLDQVKRTELRTLLNAFDELHCIKQALKNCAEIAKREAPQSQELKIFISHLVISGILNESDIA